TSSDSTLLCAYGTLIASGWVSSIRGANVQTTNPFASNVWWIGGGWWIVPVIGSKSSALNVNGYANPSHPTTSNGWWARTYRVRRDPSFTTTGVSSSRSVVRSLSGPCK